MLLEVGKKKQDNVALLNTPKSLSYDTMRSRCSFKILTWNLWAIPFAPRSLSNPRICSNFLFNNVSSEMHENWDKFDGLILCGFQELWAWNIGIFPSFILSHFISYIEEWIPFKIGYLISILFTIIAMFIGLIFKCIPIHYNPKKKFFSFTHKNGTKLLEYRYYNDHVPFFRFMDNGLLLLTNKKASEFGSNGYTHSACTDSMGFKGYIWAYFNEYNLLAITTHLQWSKKDKKKKECIEQIDELREFIYKFVENKDNKHINIIVFGDFNVDLANYESDINEEYVSLMTECDIESKLGHSIKKINSYTPTMIEKKWGCIDHIFTNFHDIKNLKENTYTHSSDHLLISLQFDAKLN